MSASEPGWPLARVGDALWAALGRGVGASPDHANPRTALAWGTAASPDAWVDAAASAASVATRFVAASHADVDATLRAAAPCLVFPTHPPSGRPEVIAVRRVRGTRLAVTHPDGTESWVSVRDLRRRLCAPLHRQGLPAILGMLRAAGVPRSRIPVAAQALLAERFDQEQVARVITLRPSASAAARPQLASVGLFAQLGGFVVAHLLSYALMLASWTWVGKAVFTGVVDPGLLIGWPVLLLAIVPARMAAAWLSGLLSIGLATLFRQRLLLGALGLAADKARLLGAGAVVGRVIESTSMESAALGGALASLAAMLEIAAGAWLLAALGLHAELVMLAAVCMVIAWGLRRYRRRFAAWTERRLELTLQLIENLAGHRTRLVDAAPSRWHEAEEARLHEYVRASPTFDRQAIWLGQGPSAIWMVGSLTAVAIQSVVSPLEPGTLAAAIGLSLLLARAVQAVVVGGTQLAQASALWSRLADIRRVPHEPTPPTNPVDARAQKAVRVGAPALEARGLSFAYATGGRRILDNVDLCLRAGDNVLLRGPSGQGKSTLAGLLCGHRKPDSGILIANALDQNVMGCQAWRKRFALVPQFYKNHLFAETLAFNLLVGRGWPASPADIRDASRICFELGLGEVIGRMPAGLDTVVGDVGWQLSHGERARVFAARALLQDADVLFFDESFAALDPETLRRVLRCVRARSKTMVVIAHP